MDQRCCRFCQREIAPSRFHPEQTACSAKACQQQRRSQGRKRKLVVDPEYRQVCRDSARKWRANHTGYWKQYRSAKPESVEQNRAQQRQAGFAAPGRSCKQQLGSEPKIFRGSSLVWLLGPAAEDLANNNLASAQVFILQRCMRKQPRPETSCKQHPSGLPAAVA